MKKQMEDNIYYKRIFIKSTSDLPENGVYFVAKKNLLKSSGLKPMIITCISAGRWLKEVEWYLIPVEQKELDVPSEEEIKTEAHERSTFHITGGVKPWDQTDSALKERLINIAKWAIAEIERRNK